MRGLAEKELTQFADRVQTRILQTAAVTQEEIDRRAAAQRQKYQTFVQNNSHFFNALLQVSGLSCNCHAVVQINDDCDDILQYAGLASTVNMQQLIDEGSDIHATRNNNLHTDDQGLKRDARSLAFSLLHAFMAIPTPTCVTYKAKSTFDKWPAALQMMEWGQSAEIYCGIANARVIAIVRQPP